MELEPNLHKNWGFCLTTESASELIRTLGVARDPHIYRGYTT
jgi:hypothetical protein